MEPLTRRTAVFVIQRTDETPSWLLDDEELSLRLRDGSFLVGGGIYKENDTKRARRALEKRFESLDFHKDTRGVRWVKYAHFDDLPTLEVRAQDGFTDMALDIDYEGAVALPGLWVDHKKLPGTIASESEWANALANGAIELASSLREVWSDCVENVVVLPEPPPNLPEEVDVVGQLADGAMLVVGPADRSWLNRLDLRTPARLIPGNLPRAVLLDYSTLEDLEQYRRVCNSPMRILSPDFEKKGK